MPVSLSSTTFHYRSCCALVMVVLFLYMFSNVAEAHQPDPEPAGWQKDVSLYYWNPATDGALTLEGLRAEYDLSEGDFLSFAESAEAAFMGMANFRNGPYLVYLNLVYANFDGMYVENMAVGPALADFNVNWEQLVTELALGYRVVEWGSKTEKTRKSGVDLMFGARYVDIEAEVKVAQFPDPAFVGFRAKGGQNWIEPWVGLRVEANLNEKWKLYGQGNVGGFGLDDIPSHSIDVIAAVQYRMTQHWAANLAYRHLELSYKQGQVVNIVGQMGDAFAHDSTLTGPIVGITYIF
jgi:opacity protein-like surface antigen